MEPEGSLPYSQAPATLSQEVSIDHYYFALPIEMVFQNFLRSQCAYSMPSRLVPRTGRANSGPREGLSVEIVGMVFFYIVLISSFRRGYIGCLLF
jgi:hypothetical protein